MNTEHTQYFIQDKQPLEQDKQPPVGIVCSQVSSGEKSGCSTGPGTPELTHRWVSGCRNCHIRPHPKAAEAPVPHPHSGEGPRRETSLYCSSSVTMRGAFNNSNQKNLTAICLKGR